MKINRAGHFLLILTASILLWAADSAFAARPDYYGVTPAMPKTSELPPFDSTFPFILSEQSILLLLEIDQTGSFVKSLPNNAADSNISKYILSSLRNMAFDPAVKHGQAVPATLPVQATVNPRLQSATIVFPVAADSQINNRSLYFLALEQLGAELPEIKKFPPYFCNLNLKDSLKILPFALLSVNLNEAGEVNSSEIVETNLPAYARQIQSAALWADISPLKLDGKSAPCTGFLLVSFFPQLQYPTNRIEFKTDSAYSWYDRRRIQFLADTVGLMLPAMPIYQNVGDLTLRSEDRHLFGELLAKIVIDTLGNVRVASFQVKRPPLQRAVSFALKNVKLFPATDYNGKHIDYVGEAVFSFQGNLNLEVEYLWLND